MSKMKYSGVEWIGDIPSNWREIRLKDIFDFEKGKKAQLYTKEYIEHNLGEYPVYSGQTENDGIMGLINSYDYDLSECLFTTTVGAKCMTLKIIQGKFSLSQNCLIMQLKYNNFINKYIYYAMLPLFENERLKIPTYMQPSLRIEDINNYKIFTPNIREQELIANFLDKKVNELDGVLNALDKQINILNNYKKSIITNIITKGLKKNVNFKDSGIDWMGKIPEHWKIKKMKYLGIARNGLTYTPDDQVEEGILVLRSSNIQNGKLSLSDNVYVDMKVPSNIILKKNDLLICSRNGSRNLIGKNLLINDDMVGNTYGAFMCVFRSDYNQYIHYVLNSNIFEHYLNTFLTSTINQLTNSNLYSIKIPIPIDKNEQKEIVEYLDKKCDQIDKIIEDKQKQIQNIEEYKKSVIYEYVTGKKRVEGAEELYG